MNTGKPKDVPLRHHKLLCDRIEQKPKVANLLIVSILDMTDKNAEHFYRRILGEKSAGQSGCRDGIRKRRLYAGKKQKDIAALAGKGKSVISRE
ncbi:MAG: hypothetical protein LBC19_15830, partial [Tannerella sp.]|nr:hypothetical protein [Tannerella sp.]